MKCVGDCPALKYGGEKVSNPDFGFAGVD